MMNRELPFVNAFGTVDISSARSINEALNISGLNWDVDQKRIFDEYGNPYDKYVANVKSDDGGVLGIVTTQYKIIQNSEAFEFVDGLVNEGFEFDSAGQFRDGRAVWVMGHLPEEYILGDNVTNNVVFVNSHDGSSGVKVMMTPVRVVCNNMLNLALKRAHRTWAAKHTRHIIAKIEEARYTLNLANKYTTALKEEAAKLSTVKLTDSDIEHVLDVMYPIDLLNDTERKIKATNQLKEDYFVCYNASDISQFKGTAWGAVNAMSDLVDHSEPRRNTNNIYSNNWNKLINGHPALDKFTELVCK